MKIINNRQIVEDSWQIIGEEASIDQLPAGKIIVPLAFWKEHKNNLSQRSEPLGIKLIRLRNGKLEKETLPIIDDDG